ncbi:MAG TPA: recombinase family protein [Candidatus Limnocylindrales bacterium]|nr:recombinase family protein [Candidatus Limnocylindrales bacterium]
MGRIIKRPVPHKTEAEKPLRYVLYARKSSIGEDAQAQSVPDQLKHCREYAEREGLIIAATVDEDGSAWIPNNRKKFTQILADITAGKYDGILSWHPDRLSRNMLESGMVMDMLDSGIIKDLQFPTVQFTNNAAGKLLLNILFAMAKNYTDSQSENVRRGVSGSFERGKASAYKWGYLRDEVTGYYEPDKNFDLINRGWQMRVEGSTASEVVEFWRKNDVHRLTKITRKNKKVRKIVLTKQIASHLFHDPFYFGILIQKEQETDLRLITNFVPMIDEDTYNAVQAMSQKRARVLVHTKRATFYPLRAIVFCGVCKSDVPMRVGKNRSSNGKYYLTYRCDNKDCSRSVKSVRAKYIFDPLYEALDKMKFSAKEYEQYSKNIDNFTDEKVQELRAERRSLTGARHHKQKELDTKSRQLTSLPENTPEYARKTLIHDLEDLENSVIDLNEQIRTIDKKVANPAQIKIAKEEFLNLANSAADKMRAGTAVEKDMLARILLLNISLNNENAPSFIWREPFATLLKSKKILLGADERT